MPWPYKTVLVIGCTAGIGVALAERMIEAGCFVIAAGRREDRLEAFRAKHGVDKVAISKVDVTELGSLKGWAEGIIKSHPTLDCVILNAGIQRTLNFTSPSTIDLSLVDAEIATNYTSTVHLAASFLAHLQSIAPNPAALAFVTSGLALVPLPRCAGYCATKAAVHSLAWSMRAQLAAHDGSKHIRVFDIIPPAVQTELHSQQPDLVKEGLGNIGIEIGEFTEEAWEGLEGGREEILVGPLKKGAAHVEDVKREAFEKMKAGSKGVTT
ncbi:short chain dehydrogenase [Xylariaceae sp. FL0255]|nr:short chain dehydrogenase [Xylariaceae sp. FL0255]